MASNKYIAVDYGASSGRVMLAEIDKTSVGKIDKKVLREKHLK